ncbi:HpcH/HpaI aldolase family protein [Acinetobacter colistiniresistens]|uniref:Aldolase n=1 Tax=Acinetobacter colistiniresistens TaxID=280145 RepID=A0A558F316_9GAMM|nr:aldolase/citrate lyase family protein [Acinetobacter colistiniresistens]TVT79603.1 aldolase [Acinetobacter colistiniresistens]
MNKSSIPLKQRIENGELLYGIFCSIASPINIEQMALAGYDFVIIDLEHTLFTTAQVETMILAARAIMLDVFVRVPLSANHLILPLLDAGVTGIVFPRIENAQQAQQAVQYCHYMPLGQRGLNSTRLNRYGLDDLTDFVQQAAKDTIVIAMIESLNGIENLDQILKVDGIDIILEGAADLSQSMGIPWGTTHPQVKTKIQEICSKTKENGKHFCAIPRKPEDILHWKNQSIKLFVLGDDRSIIRRAHQNHIDTYKELT